MCGVAAAFAFASIAGAQTHGAPKSSKGQIVTANVAPQSLQAEVAEVKPITKPVRHKKPKPNATVTANAGANANAAQGQQQGH
jgi:hypothetical protein